MPKTNINTSNPIALRWLMNEVIFPIEEGDTTSADMVREESLKLVSYGKNRRNYLFLTQERQYQWMSVDAMEAFTKTLAALKLSGDDITLLNVNALPGVPRKEDLISSFRPRVMVLMGVPPQSIGLETFPETLSDYNGIQVFCTDTFDEMLADGDKKRLFWITIKTLLV